jgi:hypothetical protein
MKKIFNQKNFNNFVGTPLDSRVVDETGSKFAAGIVDTGGKFATGINNTSETLVKLVTKFAAGVVDTGGKFATGVADTGGQP